MDYPNKTRLKLLGRVRVLEPSEKDTLQKLATDDRHQARTERGMVITIEAFDWNCPQHIPQRLTVEEFEPVIAPLREEAERLAQENRELRAQLAGEK